MNRPEMYFRRFVFNSKINREKFIINKKKMNGRKSIQIRKFCTNINQESRDPKEPGPEDPKWWMMFAAAITAYSVDKINGSKKGKYL
jgi:hypothetical protein